MAARPFAVVATALAPLAACGGGDGSGSSTSGTGPTPVATPTPSQAARFLLQAQFSAADTELAAVARLGYARWLEEQFAVPVAEKAWDWLNTRGYNQINGETRYYDSSYPGDYALWKQLFTSADGVRKRVSLALSEFFVVSMVGLDIGWRSHYIAHYWDLLNTHAFGNFRQLLEDVTLSPAMGVYLNTRGNQKENPATGRLPDENYAREVMQLFTIGLVKLNLDGNPQRDGAGRPIETYGQEDVTNLARVFTGYDLDNTGNVNTVEPIQQRTISGILRSRLPMTLDASKHPSPSTTSRHSSLQASFLGVTIPANTDGTAALKTALDALFNHPNVGPFFGRQMIQRLVTGDPSPAYVARVAAAFNDNGAGVRGDLKSVWRAVLLDPEARDEASLTSPGWGKVREPMVRFVQWGRTFPLASTAGSWKIGDRSDVATSLGQSVMRSPSVFNFFRPGYVPAGTALSASKTTAPEFQIVNETSVAGYLNYIQGAVLNGIFVTAPNQPNSGSNASNGFDIKPNYTAELALATDPAALVARLDLLLTANQLSTATVAAIVSAVTAISVTGMSVDAAKLNRVAAAVFLVMASPEYLIQK